MVNMYSFVKDLWKKPKANLGDAYKQRQVEWRKESTVERIAKPTRIDKARALGYKAKQGYIMLRVRTLRGGRKRENITGGRRSKNNSQRKDLDMNYRLICEKRGQAKYHNLEVLNSYYVGKDGRHVWYEVIMVDPENPAIKADSRINWICKKTNQGRVFRGLTSAAKKSRGLRVKGKGAEKARPSKTAVYKKKASKPKKVKVYK